MITVAYIMGVGLSGSTLLTLLLGSHPEVATVGEVYIAPRSKTSGLTYVCSCGLPYHECTFWQRVTKEMEKHDCPFDIHESDLSFELFGNGLSFLLLRASLRHPLLEVGRHVGLTLLPRARSELNRLLHRNETFMQVVTGMKGCQTFLDGTKNPQRAVYLQRIRGLQIKVIHLVRDGRAFAWSAMRHWGVQPEAAAMYWLQGNSQAERARHYFTDDQWMVVHHEDVCAHPQGTLAQLHAYIGVTPSPDVGNFRAGQHIVGNIMRLSTTLEIRLDERWKTALTVAQTNSIQQILGKMNRSYGYGLDLSGFSD
jgi:hypothetical protein